MSSGSYRQAYVICPFYKYDDGKRRITCEGLLKDDSIIALIYHKKQDFDTQVDVFCCKHFTKCEVFRMLNKNYEE